MRLPKFRHPMAAILGSLVAVVALTQTGCLRTEHSSADETAPGGESPLAAPTRGGEQPVRGESDQSDELRQPLLRELGEALWDPRRVD